MFPKVLILLPNLENKEPPPILDSFSPLFFGKEMDCLPRDATTGTAFSISL